MIDTATPAAPCGPDHRPPSAAPGRETGAVATPLAGKVALVTGASRGIGAAIARRLARLGARVAVNYASSAEAALALVEEIRSAGGAAVPVRADVASPAAIERMFDEVVARLGGLDIVVANAGLELVGRATVDVTEQEFDRLFAVNTKGVFFTLQQAARRIADRGRIVVVGSSTTKFPMPGHALYGASKVAPLFLVEVLAKELGGRGITVNAVLPSATEGAGVSTRGVRDSVRRYIEQFNPMQRAATLTDVADAVEYLVGDLSAYVSGQHLLLSGGAPA